MSSLTEIKRLEQLINQNIAATQDISRQVQSLREDVIVIETQRTHDKELADKTAEQIENLTAAINALNETFAVANGKAQGISMTAKAFWSIIGVIVTGSIFWVSNTVVDLKTHVAVLESLLRK